MFNKYRIPSEIGEIANDYQKGLGVPQLALKYKKSRSCIAKYLRIANIEPVRKDGLFTKKVLGEEIEQKIIRDYTMGASFYLLERKYPICRATLRNFLAGKNLVPRYLPRKKVVPKVESQLLSIPVHEPGYVSRQQHQETVVIQPDLDLDKSMITGPPSQAHGEQGQSHLYKPELPTKQSHQELSQELSQVVHSEPPISVSVERQPPTGPVKKRRGTPPQVIEAFCKEYQNCIVSIYDLAKIFSIHPFVIRYHLKRRKLYGKSDDMDVKQRIAHGAPVGNIRKRAREISPEVLEALTSIVLDPEQDPKARIVAGKEILDRAWGKPREDSSPEEDSEPRDISTKILRLVPKTTAEKFSP